MKKEREIIKREFSIDKYVHKKNKSNRFLILISVFAVCLCFVYALHVFVPDLSPEYKIFFYNKTESVPYGIYLRIPMGKIEDGDYVVYMPKKETLAFAKERGWIEKDTYFLKMVGAVEGENYRIDSKNYEFYANGKYYGVAAISDMEMRPLPMKVGLHYVPKGEFLPVGTHPKSFDGRYMGCVPVENVLAKVIPLITFQ